MNQGDYQAANPYASFGSTIADAPVDTRVAFIRKTYTHLMIAVYACAAICWAMFQLDIVEPYAQAVLSNRMYWLIVLGGFMGVSWLANSWASSNTSVGLQYAGLSIYVVAWSAMLCPLLYIAQFYAVEIPGLGGKEIDVISAAAVITLVMFGGLSAVAWISKADFSFLGFGLRLAGFAALGLIVASMIGGFHLGVWFTAAMVVFASAYILYDTSNVMHHYREGQHVAASLALFASVALLFWYVLQLLMSLSSRD